MTAQQVTCSCGAVMNARNIGSHQLSAKHAQQMAETRAHTPGVRPGERKWSVVSKYNHDHTPKARTNREQQLLARLVKVQQAQGELQRDAVECYEAGYMTTSEIANLLGVSRTTIFAWRKELTQ